MLVNFTSGFVAANGAFRTEIDVQHPVVELGPDAVVQAMLCSSKLRPPPSEFATQILGALGRGTLSGTTSTCP